MKKLALILTLFCLLFKPFYLEAQDFNVHVSTNSAGVSITNRQILTSLSAAIENFFDNTSFSGIRTKIQERIEANIVLTIISFDNDKAFKVAAQIQTFRPVYNTSYKTTILTLQDKTWLFEYYEGRPIVYNEVGNNDELTLLLAYYAYVMLGFDADTFSMQGGTPYFNKAQNIISQAQSANRPGWGAANTRQSRFWLIENVLNPALSELRNFFYVYHRQALDILITNPSKAQEVIVAYLPRVQKALESKPNSYYADLFFSSKVDELINIFQNAPLRLKYKTVALLKAMNPANAQAYDRILNANKTRPTLHLR